MEIKPSAFSHSWYPGDAGECEQAITAFVKENCRQKDPLPARCVGGIVPHAGWVFSGRIACRVIQALSHDASADTIVLFGAHMRPSDPGFVLASGGVDTPLGPIETDAALAECLARVPGVQALSPAAFPDENTLELQYPFIRYFFPEVKLLAAGVPPSEDARRMAEAVVDGAKNLGRRMLVIGSTDMTHYGPNFGFEPAGRQAVDWVSEFNDAAAVAALATLDGDEVIRQGLQNRNLCCSGAAAAAALACKKMGAAQGISLNYATSYEISRSDSFVGYCGMVFA